MRTKAEQIAAIRADQQFWRDLAVEVRPDRIAEPGTFTLALSFERCSGISGRRRLAPRLRGPDPPDWPPRLGQMRPPSEVLDALAAEGYP